MEHLKNTDALAPIQTYWISDSLVEGQVYSIILEKHHFFFLAVSLEQFAFYSG